MKPEYRILLLAIIITAAFDTAGSIASRQFNFNYALLTLGSFIIYGAFAFIATAKKDLITGVATATAIGLFDATIGWRLSVILHANTGGLNNNPTVEVWIGTAMFVIISAAIIGLIAGLIARAVFKSKRAV
ncbi:hypothetical protein HDF24_02565 [Mucilaginibacter sp. X4EP1]|uniref:hypothetical protein n=1 Tax=Mucilaginibacter sp. X4EP1 TaxID=2723092 RepID=UPI002168BA9F|nr:hypothetical protein [Mucilaginibacter sp. X4EP1]MCS3811901.1 putative membrane protein YeaQ/YmgE (transglycosylase-associated protein family) [Mucilaginibacter sp. X4EP1]